MYKHISSGHSGKKTARQLSLPVVYQTTTNIYTYVIIVLVPYILQTKQDKWMDRKRTTRKSIKGYTK